MSESVYSEAPSYHSRYPESDDEDPSPLLTPLAAHHGETTSIPPPLARLAPVSRVPGTPPAVESTPDSNPGAPFTSPVEIRTSTSSDIRTRGEAGESGRRPDPTSVQRISHFGNLRARPTKNVEFTFSPVGTNAMLLLPPPEEQDARPRYYITVIQNCFMPLSHITTIYRGASDSAPRVGEFEMGILGSPCHRQMENQPAERLMDVLEKKGSKTKNGKWAWYRRAESGPPRLFWNCNVVPFICITVPPDSNDIDSSTTIAWFTPRHAKKEVPTTLCRLQVTPSGQTLFDDIVMSILAIERRILTPYNFTAESLFNYSSLEL
ncbi:hypothetical protein D9619_002307 [Psilocybe cf. subviscida]|uniref:Uncharacterized protein n=1 Tax=Psilocybe cf. subviscida TaxID=2480587 RepID=A0A8H5AWC6_9AGAR|nr:hypothetical protein D9619_002307 [Psilocybe cf. subviscida]